MNLRQIYETSKLPYIEHGFPTLSYEQWLENMVLNGHEVYIEVQGGVAEVVKMPPYIKVTIHDYDDEEEAGPEIYKPAVYGFKEFYPNEA